MITYSVVASIVSLILCIATVVLVIKTTALLNEHSYKVEPNNYQHLGVVGKLYAPKDELSYVHKLIEVNCDYKGRNVYILVEDTDEEWDVENIVTQEDFNEWIEIQ